METEILGCEERIAYRLRQLFEQRGFRRTRVNRFEDYALYMDNKSFLQAERIITFMDMDGRLLALKPDVTLSVIKNIPGGKLPAAEKLYYADEVYRISRENRAYHARSQVGVELVGAPDTFASAEIIDLALESLALISKQFVLDISHLGFVAGLLEKLALSAAQERQLLAGIHTKSMHEVAEILRQANVTPENREKVLALAGLHGTFAQALPQARALVSGDAMQAAYEELERLGGVLGAYAQNVRLDFSIVNDLAYYNGLTFLGYVEGIPRMVLSGGRYDGLLHKMGKESGAIGFAVSLDELSGYGEKRRSFDFDVLLTYEADCDWAALLQYTKQLCADGERVRLERADSDPAAAGLTFGHHIHFNTDFHLKNKK